MLIYNSFLSSDLSFVYFVRNLILSLVNVVFMCADLKEVIKSITLSISVSYSSSFIAVHLSIRIFCYIGWAYSLRILNLLFSNCE